MYISKNLSYWSLWLCDDYYEFWIGERSYGGFVEDVV